MSSGNSVLRMGGSRGLFAAGRRVLVFERLVPTVQPARNGWGPSEPTTHRNDYLLERVDSRIELFYGGLKSLLLRAGIHATSLDVPAVVDPDQKGSPRALRSLEHRWRIVRVDYE
jgi:hypothetical protein